MQDMDKVDKVLTSGVAEVLPGKDGLAKVMGDKKIRVYLGIDPTGIQLHLGHTIPLRKLQQFAGLGHHAILLIGTGTVLAGDPSQRKTGRAKITKDEIEKNIATWKDQASKVIDFAKVELKYNADWLLKLGYADIIEIASHISSVQLFKRGMFQERTKKGDVVYTHETLYPLFQGYDSVVLDVDLEIGGTDQTFNMLIGRELQKKMKNREKFVLTTPLINGTDGKQMSKSSGNCIWLTDSADEMFGKIMSLDDSQIESYWQNLTDLDDSKITNLKPIDAKKRLASEIVRMYHGQDEASKAQSHFENTFQKGQLPEEVETIKLADSEQNLVDFLTDNQLAKSRSDAKRLIDQGAIEIDGQTVKDETIEFQNGQVVKIGKKKFVKINLL